MAKATMTTPDTDNQPGFAPVYPLPGKVPALSSPETYSHGHPFELYRQLRETAPVYWHDGGTPDSRFWALTAYEDIKAVSRNPAEFSSAQGFRVGAGFFSEMDPSIIDALQNIMISLDEPNHMTLRRIVAPRFTTKHIEEWQTRIRQITRELLDEITGQQVIDFVPVIAAQLPIQLLIELLGVPLEDQPRIIEWSDRMVGAQDPELNISPAKAGEAYMLTFEYGRKMIEERRKNPTDDIVSLIANARIDGELLERKQTDGFFMLMVGAGNETTRNAITKSIMALSRYPEQKKRLLENPDLLQLAVEELLRFDAPVIHMKRTVRHDTELHGQKLAAGETVVLMYGAADRDPSVFPDPDTLDISRQNAKEHLAFGIGPHICLGAHLARLEMRVILEEVLKRFPDIRAIDEPQYLRSNFVSGIKSLPVSLI